MENKDLPINIFDTYNKMMPNNIVDRFGRPRPKLVTEKDDYLWEEANFYNLNAELDNKTGEFFFDNKALIEPGKYLYLNKQNHNNYLIDKQKIIDTGARFELEDGKEYFYYDDEYENTDENDVYGKQVLQNEIDNFSIPGLKNFEVETTEDDLILHGNAEKIDDKGDPLNNKTLNEEIKYLVKNVSNRIKKHFVGNVNDFGRINAEMIGVSNLNLAIQLATKNLPGGSWQLEGAAPIEEALGSVNNRDDYTIYEQIAEQILGIIYDSPTIAAATMATMAIPFVGKQPATIGFNVGFVNSSIKESLIVSLQRGDVNSFNEWKQVWLKQGIAEGLHAGMHLGTAMGLGQTFGMIVPKSFLPQLATQVLGFEIATKLVYGEDFTTEKAIVTTGTFGALGVALSPLKAARSLFRVVDKHRLISEKGEFIKQEIKNGRTIDKIAEELKIDKSIIEDIKSFDGTLDALRAFEKPGKAEFDVRSHFESYKNPERIAREQKLLEQRRAKIKELGEKLKGHMPERYEFKKLTKEQIKEKLELELEKLKKDKSYIPEEYGYEIELLLTNKEQRVKFNKQLQTEIKEMLRDNYRTIPEKIKDSVKSFKDIVNNAQKKHYDAHFKDYKKELNRLTQQKIFQGQEISPVDYASGINLNKTLINSKRSPFENLMTAWFDKLHPFHQISNRIIMEREKMQRGKGNILANTLNVEKILQNTLTGAKAMQLATGTHNQISHRWITQEQLNYNGAKVGQSYESIVGDLNHTKLKDFKILNKDGKIETVSLTEFAQFDIYLIARRAVEEYRLNPKAQDGSFYYTLEQARQITNQFEIGITRTGKKSKFKEKAELLDKYQDNLIQYLVDAEVMSAKQAIEFKKLNKNYVPWYHKTQYKNSGKLNLNDFEINDPIRKMSTKGDKLQSPMESIYKNTFLFIETAQNNASLRQFINELTEHRKFIDTRNKTFKGETSEIILETDPSYLPEIFRTSTKAEKAALKENVNVESIINKSLAKEMYSKGLGNLDLLFEPLNTKKLARTQVVIYKKGVPEIWNMPEYLTNSLKENHTFSSSFGTMIKGVAEAPYIGEGLKFSARALRKGVTADPRFLWNVFIKDSQLTSINSNNWALGFYQATVGLFTMLGSNKTLGTSFAPKEWQVHYRRWLREGGPTAVVQADQAYSKTNLIQTIQEQAKHNQPIVGNEKLALIQNMTRRFARAKENVKNTMDKIYFSQESPNRLGEYILNRSAIKKNIKKGKISYMKSRDAVRLSVYESRNLIDFSKSGILGEIVNQHSGFFNAGLQGTAKIWEVFGQGTPGKAFNFSKMTKSLTYSLLFHSLPSAFLWYINHDDPVYRRQNQWLKDLYWLIPLKNENGETQGFIPVAKPWEQGLIFATGIEKMLDWIYNYDEEGYFSFIDNVTRTYVRNTVPRIGGILTTGVETLNNYSIRTGNPIIPDKQINTNKNLQFNINSNPLSKKISEIGGKLEEYGEEEKGITPFLAENIARIIPGTQKIDYLIRGIFGTIWDYKSGLLNQIIRQEELQVDAPLPDFDNYWDEFLDSKLFSTWKITTTYTDEYNNVNQKIKMSAAPITDMYKIWRDDFLPLKNKLDRLKKIQGEDSEEVNKLLDSEEYEAYLELNKIMQQEVYPLLTEYNVLQQTTANPDKKDADMTASNLDDDGKEITDKQKLRSKQILDRRMRMYEISTEIYELSIEFHDVISRLSGKKNKYSVKESDYDHWQQFKQNVNKYTGTNFNIGPSYSERANENLENDILIDLSGYEEEVAK